VPPFVAHLYFYNGLVNPKKTKKPGNLILKRVKWIDQLGKQKEQGWYNNEHKE
jgi:hypothetical protein